MMTHRPTKAPVAAAAVLGEVCPARGAYLVCEWRATSYEGDAGRMICRIADQAEVDRLTAPPSSGLPPPPPPRPDESPQARILREYFWPETCISEK